MNFLKRNLPLIICFTAGVLYAASFYMPAKFWKELQNQGGNSYTIISALALLFGCVYTAVFHLDKIKRKEKGFGFSLILIASMAATFAAGIHAKGDLITTSGTITAFGWIFKYFFVPLSATMFSLLGFFIASAAFRAFKIKSFLSLVLFLSATIVILGRIPFVNDFYKSLFGGTVLPPSFYVEWILKNPGMAAQRAILIGVTFGIVATSFKTILGMDRSWLGKEGQNK